MHAHDITSAPSAYAYPLLIKQLLHTALANARDDFIFPGVLFVTALDKISVGKFDKKVLRQKYRSASCDPL